MKTTRISAWVAAGLVVGTALFTACSKSDDTPSLPPIGGYNNSDEVGASNLIAYWPFEGNFNETKQNLTGTNSGATFTTGIKGQAYQGSGASFVQFKSPGTALAALKSYTVSVWIKEPAQPVNNTTASYVAGQGAQGILFVYDQAGNDWNLLHMNLEPYNATSDTLRIHAGFNNTGAPEYKGIVPEGLLPGSINKWVHIAMTYDGGTSVFTLYKNGIPVEVSSAWGKSANTQVWTNGNKTTPMGNISFKTAPGGIVLGAFPQAVSPSISTAIGGPQPWSGNLQGSMDQLRIYSKALAVSDIGALYSLELAGR